MTVQNKTINILAAAMLFTGGYLTHYLTHKCPEQKPKIVTEYVDRVKTEVAYVPKAKADDADIDININKPELKVKVNNKTVAVQKAEDEQYIFDKNKLTMTQSSQADLNITVPTIDQTKRWEIGVGMSRKGTVGLVGFPINRNLGGWVAGNRENVMVGVSVKF